MPKSDRHSRRELLLGRLLREPEPVAESNPVPLRAFLYGVDAAPEPCAAEVPADESPPPWARRT
ncbi:MAG: hypothetical protein ACI8RZ_000077, partial [Myxococcota bacterium]